MKIEVKLVIKIEKRKAPLLPQNGKNRAFQIT